MQSLLLAAIGIVLVPSSTLADGMILAGSLWQCTRSSNGLEFVITFYPGGGVGGGELEKGEVSSYIFDVSLTKQGEWPSKWEQTGPRFTWAFPDQSIQIEGSLQGSSQPAARLVGCEISSGDKSAVTCTGLSRLPKIGEGLVIPRDSRFIDLDREEGELKVPAGISLQEQGSRLKRQSGEVLNLGKASPDTYIKPMSHKRSSPRTLDLFEVTLTIPTPAPELTSVAVRPPTLASLSDAQLAQQLGHLVEEVQRRLKTGNGRQPDLTAVVQQAKLSFDQLVPRPAKRVESSGSAKPALSLQEGQRKAVRAALVAGVTPTRVAKHFGLPLAAVRKVLDETE